jgi:type IV secretion system protein VirD4
MDKDSLKFKIVINIFLFLIIFFVCVSLASILFVQFMGLSLDNAMPWTAFQYWFYYSDNPVVQRRLLISHGIAGIAGIAFIAILVQKKVRSLFGDAKWATEKDLKESEPNLRGTKGIIIGMFNGKYLIQAGQQFVTLMAPTRSKKGVAVVIPNCLNWHESLVCTDVKLENYRISSGYRKSKGQKVFLFNPSPTDYKTHRWNALAYISEDKNFRIDDIQKIANFLVPTPTSGDPMWSSEGRSLFMSIVLFILDDGRFPVTLGEVFRQLNTEKESSEYFSDILNANNDELDAICVMGLNKFCNLPDKQREGVKSGVVGALNLWANPLLDAATCENDFDFRDLRKEKMSIFVGITPDNLDRLSPVLNLFFQQLVDLNTRALPDKVKEPYSCLLLLDEFPALGKVLTITKGVSYIAGYNLRLLTIAQSFSQYVDIYGRDSATNFIENHATKIVYAPKNIAIAKEISEELGDTTVSSDSISRNRELGKGDRGNKTTSNAKRALLLPQEIKSIGQNKEIILSENCKPVMANKIIYFADDNFLKRCILPENMKAAKQSKDQETFLSLVRPVAEIPIIEVKPHEIRGLKEREFDLNFDSVVLPEDEGSELSEEQIDAAADEFMALLNAS